MLIILYYLGAQKQVTYAIDPATTRILELALRGGVSKLNLVHLTS